jgi:hypothetical protein
MVVVVDTDMAGGADTGAGEVMAAGDIGTAVDIGAVADGGMVAGAGMVVAGMVAAHVFGLAAYGSASNAFCGCVMLSAATQ